MCFTHQRPWHRNMTCAQYDCLQEHGDPNYQETQDFIRKNTKPCPNPSCKVNIEKGNACFHMTCKKSILRGYVSANPAKGTACKYEFCWVCLADWHLIRPEPGTYVQEAHAEGCIFRTTDIQPTHILGYDAEVAVAAMTRRLRRQAR